VAIGFRSVKIKIGRPIGVIEECVKDQSITGDMGGAGGLSLSQVQVHNDSKKALGWLTMRDVKRIQRPTSGLDFAASLLGVQRASPT
jgi:hypothetical protein